MNDWLDFFRIPNVLPIVTLICLLSFVASRFGEETVFARRCAQALGMGTFIVYAACWFDKTKPSIPSDYVVMVTQALLAMGVSHGVGRMAGSVIGFVHVQVISRPLEHFRRITLDRKLKEDFKRDEKSKREKEEAKKAEVEELQRRRREEDARRPPPPTLEEKAQAAERRYLRTVKTIQNSKMDDMEIKSALEKAKQRYLQDMDGLL